MRECAIDLAKRVVLGVAVSVSLWVTACADKPTTEGISFFENKVRPLLVDRCLDCHTDEDPESELSLDSLAGMLKGGLRGPAIVIGKPEESLLIRALRHSEVLKMPAKKKLPTAQIADVAQWIKMGAPWPNAQPVTAWKSDPVDDAVSFSEEQRSFWAFTPPVKATVPEVNNQAWIASPIDAFVLRKLGAAGLLPAPPADKRTLIRRATLDLHGLPPTPEEVDAFVADNSPHALAKLVDRLLSSPRYGERWGRHWLDVARYADSNGLDENLAFANAYRYRDYVIAAFNKDKPYDWFVQEQIAGDLLGRKPFPDWDAPYEGDIATGFLALGAKMLAEDDPVKMQMDIIDEQVDTLGRAFLGMTFGCARCHDHKFDPIPTADYYSLAGIFKSTKTMENFNVVARWQEKPLASAEATAALQQHQQRIESQQAAIKELVTQGNTTIVAEARQHVGDYLLAALELQQTENLIANATVHGEQPNPLSVPGSLLIEADEYVRGNVLRDRTNYGAGIGVLVNSGETPNYAEYEIEVEKAGLYQLEIRVAAADSRPTILNINGRLAKPDAASAVTGSWYPDGQKWFVEGFFYLRGGTNLIRLQQPRFFPHIDKLLLVPAPPDAKPTSPDQAIDAFAGEPQDGVVLIEAETVSRGNLSVLTEGYGEGIGIIGGPAGPNEGEIDVQIPSDGVYQIAVRYAAEAARPTKLLIDGRTIKAKAIGEVTGTWFPDTQRWFLEGRVRLKAGQRVVRLERNGPIPHIDKIMFLEDSHFGGHAAAPLGEYEPKAEFVRQWADFLEKDMQNPNSPLADWYAAMERDADLRELAASFSARAMADPEADPSLAAILNDPGGPFTVPESLVNYFPPETQDRLAELRGEEKRLQAATPNFPETMAVSEATPERLRIHIRGSHLTQGREVPRRFPRIFSHGEPTAEIGEDSSGRLEIAAWMTNPEHPLTARVIVNRIWLWHFGEGLVRSPDNFGMLGLRPTHPELLDWLAVDFVQSGWSLKRLHRKIMLSATYQMSTTFNEQAAAFDPDNKLLWRFNRKRLQAESIRDSILAAGGLLDLSMGGSILPTKNRAYVTSTANVDPVAYKTNRRSVYMPVVRSALFDVFQAFDFAEPSVSSGQRQSTTVAPQALFMMNSQIVSEATRAMAAQQLADSSGHDEARIVALYRTAYGRPPSDRELERAAAFIAAYTESLIGNQTAPEQARMKAWQSLCRVILSANEFIYVE